MIVEVSLLLGRPGTVGLKNGKLGARFDDGKHIDLFTTGQPDPFVHAQGPSPCLSLTLHGPVAVSTVPAAVSDVRAILDTAKEATAAQAEAFGENADAYAAMRAGLAWNTIFDPEHNRICTPVTRHWSEGNGGYVLFEWDTYFAALMSARGSKTLALLNALAITNEATEAGFVPNFAVSNGGKSRDPFGSRLFDLCVCMLQRVKSRIRLLADFQNRFAVGTAGSHLLHRFLCVRQREHRIDRRFDLFARKDLRNPVKSSAVFMNKDEVIALSLFGGHPVIFASGKAKQQTLERRHPGSRGKRAVGQTPQGHEHAAFF